MKIEAVILDWAGTAVDFGCLAPVGVFVELFRRRGVALTWEAARGPMGTHKREHIRRLCEDPEVRAGWIAVHGSPPADADIDAMYQEGEPLQVEVIPEYAGAVPGLHDTVARIRAEGIRLGSTTGYNRVMLDTLLRASEARGYTPDVAIPASEVPAGRPAPYLNWTAATRLGVTCADACVVVGDTPVDMAAGRAAGMWTVGVAVSGNEVGLSEAEWVALPASEQERRRARARERLFEAGAHVVIDGVWELVPVVRALGRR